MKEKIDLLSCPFCENEKVDVYKNEFSENIIVYYVKCSNYKCRCCGPHTPSMKKAILTWNQRTLI